MQREKDDIVLRSCFTCKHTARNETDMFCVHPRKKSRSWPWTFVQSVNAEQEKETTVRQTMLVAQNCQYWSDVFVIWKQIGRFV